jgi:chromosome segregation ATPase
LEVRTLTERAQKGKMPRRQYKVQKRALELRIGTLSKVLADLKPTFSAAGGNYADLTRQLDSAESEVRSAETNLRIAEARHRTGELALEDYKKSILDLSQRKEKAESKINGILLRLREETR